MHRSTHAQQTLPQNKFFCRRTDHFCGTACSQLNCGN